jgi:beta-lactamase class A
MITRLARVAILQTGLATLTIAAGAQAQTSGLDRLEREIERLAALSGGTMGVGAIHLETGRSVFLNAEAGFPMASSYKVPIAVQLLTRVQRGEFSLDSMVVVAASDLHPGSGMLSELLDDPGVVISLRNLLELMLLISDNSATDLVMAAAGGAEAVTARMHELGYTGIRVDRPTVHLIADWVGVDLPPSNQWSPALYPQLFATLDDDARERAAEAFDRDPQDTATPRHMAELLAAVWRREILNDELSGLLLDIMLRSTTGGARLKGLLPPDTDVYHKTGTIGGTTNDVGIIALPDGAGHVVTVAFVRESTIPVPERERAIAHIARAVHDFFTFNPGL